jgi:alginate O-acetyltransferase complex protein AlgI
MNPLIFADPAFLFCFAPVVLTVHYALPRSWRNGFLLAASVFLYAWGEGRNITVLLASMTMNYAFGLFIGRSGSSRKWLLVFGVAANLLLLSAFKYVAFLIANADVVLGWLGLPALIVPKIRLPIGISFFTFMAISYLVDVYRREVGPERNPASFGLYIAMFPHLMAGPIVRFQDIAAELHGRITPMPEVAQGIRRFVIGLGKKVLIGNTVATTADAVFALSADRLSAPLAWVGLLCYTVQIYFDFSGYSDMAIGLARMLGFHFPENFNYPYISQSLTDFWRRWHISLSTWLRDYLLFPMPVRGGRWKVYRNVLIVFLLCGLWHGAAWHFVLWGLFNGTFLVIERLGLSNILAKSPRAIRHVYALLTVMVGFVLFRAATIPAAGAYVAAMFGLGHAPLAGDDVMRYLPLDVALALAAGMLGSTPLRTWLPRWEVPHLFVPAAEFSALTFVFVFSAAFLSAQTYHPFIYFRF